MAISSEEISKYVDLEDGLSRVRGNKTLFKRMLGMFKASQDFDALEQAIANKEYKKAGDIAHTIKGMSGNLGLRRVFELSAELMHKLREDEYPEDLHIEYREAIHKTMDSIDALNDELV